MRNSLTSVLLLAIVILAGAGAYFYEQHHQPAAPAQVSGTPVTYSELAHGTDSTVLSRRNYVIHSAAELEELWQMTDATAQVPSVDFGANDVIAVFAGQEPTAGYSISVSQVADASTSRTVEVTLSSPGGSCALAQKLTAPYQIIELPKSELPLTHVDNPVTESCLN